MKEEIIVVGYQLRCTNREHVNKEISNKTVIASVGIGMQWNNPLCGCGIADQDIRKVYQEPT
jgi:hypothetical protein